MDSNDEFKYRLSFNRKVASADPNIIARKNFKDWVNNHKKWRGPFDIDFTTEMEYSMMIVR